MQIKELADLLLHATLDGESSTVITGIEFDSRQVQEGDLFICLVGHQQDGHHYAQAAVEQGAAALVVERKLAVEAPQIIVKDTRYAMAVIASHYYRYPSHEMSVIGITGTNGKTTTAALIEKILADHGHITGLMGTVRMKIGNESYDTRNTTQDALEIQRNFRKMRDADTRYCVMEVSSHGLALGRVKGIDFRTAIFTNLSQDHLNFHISMERYKAAKGLLFSRLGNTFSPLPEKCKFAVLNADDEASIEYRELTSAEVLTYGIEQEADVKASDIRLSSRGTTFLLTSFAGNMEFQMNLVGKFNVYNALAAITAALCEGISLDHIQQSFLTIYGVDGRFEPVAAGQDYSVIVDYAHTPDGLENVLATVKDIAAGRTICVFGCGGDRDQSKRPIMGEIAARYSDYIIVTSDNPRTEDPVAIMEHIKAGLTEAGVDHTKYELIEDRQLAIQKAVEIAGPKDVVLIAGKGHETYQEINGIRHNFDDRVVAKNAIRSRIQ